MSDLVTDAGALADELRRLRRRTHAALVLAAVTLAAAMVALFRPYDARLRSLLEQRLPSWEQSHLRFACAGRCVGLILPRVCRRSVINSR
jgi:hypothetical protein